MVSVQCNKAGARIGRNVRIGESVRPSDFTSKTIKSGGSVEAKRTKAQVRRDASSAAAKESAPEALSASADGKGGARRRAGSLIAGTRDR